MKTIIIFLVMTLSLQAVEVTDDMVVLAVHAVISQDQFQGECLRAFRKMYARVGLKGDRITPYKGKFPGRVNVFYKDILVATIQTPIAIKDMEFNQRFMSGKEVKFKRLKYHKKHLKKIKIPRSKKKRIKRDKKLSRKFEALVAEYFRRLFSRVGLAQQKLLFLINGKRIVVFYDDLKLGELYYPHQFI